MSRVAKRISYALALIASVTGIAISSLGLAGVLETDPGPSPSVIAAASELATFERTSADCPWPDHDPDQAIEASALSGARSQHSA